MRFKHKYVDPAVIYFLIYIFGIILLVAGTVIARYAHTYMNFLLPDIFPTFSPVSEKELYRKYLIAIDIIGVFIALFLINVLAMLFDNKKFELIISRTDGQYTIKGGLEIYVNEFLISDIISTVALPTVLAISAYLIPEIPLTKIPIVNLLIRIAESFFWLGNTMEGFAKIFVCIPIIIVFSCVARMITVPIMLRRWRAAWLSGSIS